MTRTSRRATARTLLVLMMLIPTSGCSVFLNRNPMSEQLQDEHVALTVTHTSDSGAESLGMRTAPALAALVLPTLIDYGLRFVHGQIEREADRYSAAYTGTVVDGLFYKAHKVDEKDDHYVSNESPAVAVERFDLRRTVADRATGEEVEAFHLQLAPVLSPDGTHFRLLPTALKLGRSKAKLRASDETIDLSVTVTIDSYWIDEKDAAQHKTITLPPMEFRNVPLPADGRPSAEQKSRIDDLLQQVATAWIPMLPRSVHVTGTGASKSTTYGTGLYAMTVRVEETDDFGNRVRSVAEYVDSNKADWSKWLLEQLTKKDGGS